jgi:Sugar (and other) transporter
MHSGNFGAKIYLLFAGCMVVVIICVWLFLPELSGRTAAEIDEMFELKLPARQFKGM